jgi:hypothetical protein
MLKSLLIALTVGASFLTFTAASGFAQSKDSMPPLIDREIFFGNPEIAGAQISPDGRFISFIKPYKNVRNIWVKGTGEPFEKARVVTAEAKRPATKISTFTRSIRRKLRQAARTFPRREI